MANYMIHTYPKRLWYVEQYLVPSMVQQGIDNSQIIIYNDTKGLGNLKACMDAFLKVPDDDKGTWHLQDDVIICKDFKERTEEFDDGVVCGFSSNKYDGFGNIGPVERKYLWFSFPCIRIPNKYARECSEWITRYIIGNPIYAKYWQKGVNDDWAFRIYLKSFHEQEYGYNLAPNLVDHIDYLIGGGSGGQRDEIVRAQYWEDDDLVKQLEDRLNGNYSSRNKIKSSN